MVNLEQTKLVINIHYLFSLSKKKKKKLVILIIHSLLTELTALIQLVNAMKQRCMFMIVDFHNRVMWHLWLNNAADICARTGNVRILIITHQRLENQA